MRINELNSILEENKLDFALFYNLGMETNPNMFYFSGYSGLGALVISKKQTPFLIVPKMEFLRAKKSMIKKIYLMEKKRFFGTIYDMVKKNKIKMGKIAIDNNNFNLNVYKEFKKQFKIRENQRFSGHRKSKGFSREIRTKDISRECLRLRQFYIS